MAQKALPRSWRGSTGGVSYAEERRHTDWARLDSIKTFCSTIIIPRDVSCAENLKTNGNHRIDRLTDTRLLHSSSRCFILPIATSLSQRRRSAQSRRTLSAGSFLSRTSGRLGGRSEAVSSASARPVARALRSGLSPAVSRKRLTEKPRYSAWTRVAAI